MRPILNAAACVGSFLFALCVASCCNCDCSGTTCQITKTIVVHEPARNVAGEVVRNALFVRNEDGAIGSAIAIKCGGKVLYLTAAHVVAANMEPVTHRFTDPFGHVCEIIDPSPRPLVCHTRDGRHHTARVVWYSKGWQDGAPDLALMEPDLVYGLPGVELLVGQPELGDTAWFCGSGGGVPFVLEKTIVSRMDERYFAIGGMGWYGHSGSGVLIERNGKVYLAGIVSQWAQDVREFPRTSILCEYRLEAFLDTYLHHGVCGCRD